MMSLVWLSVIHDLNFTDTMALLLACPPYLLACVAALILAWSSGHFHERTWHITIGFLVAIAGFAAAASTTNTAERYVACFIFPAGAFAVNSVITGWIATTLSQNKEKKAVCSLGLTSFNYPIMLLSANTAPSALRSRWLLPTSVHKLDRYMGHTSGRRVMGLGT